MTVVNIKNISKSYSPGEYILEDINIDINDAEIFTLLGQSGCGKSTLLRIIAGFEPADQGQIIIDGQDITNLPAHKRPVNMMFQNYALFPHMTIADNIKFGLKQDKTLLLKEINQRAHETAEMLDISSLLNRYPHQLSGGQQQRAALARSIVKRPKLLLLDEPLGSLDRNIREKTQMELIKIQDYLDITFIIVTHDQDEAMSLSDHIGFMQNGRIVQTGSPIEIYEAPNSLFVARFVGSMNIFYGKIIESDGKKATIYVDDIATEFTIKTNKKYITGKEVALAIRPEEMTIACNDKKKEENNICGEIIDIAFMGSQIFYHVKLGDDEIIHVSVPTAARNINPRLKLGEKAYISWHDSDGVILEE